MNIEQRILWATWFQWDDCQKSGLFEKIKPDMFPNQERAFLFEKLQKRKIEYSDDELGILFKRLEAQGIISGDNIWVPIIPDRLRSELKEEWRRMHVGVKLSDAHKALIDGKDYHIPLSQISSVEESFDRKSKSSGELMEEIMNEYASGKQKGIKTGIEKLDTMTDCLKKGHLWVIGGYTGRGKTTLALQLVMKALEEGNAVNFISLEMTAKQLMSRMVWLYCCILKKKFPEMVGKVFDLPFNVVENKFSPDEIRNHIEANSGTVKIFILDYIQNMTGPGKEYERTDSNVKLLQRLAIQNNVCIVALSQMSNESVKDENKTETMGFKGAGAIAACADVGIEIIRKKNMSIAILSETIITVRKNKYGPEGPIKCDFNTQGGYYIF